MAVNIEERQARLVDVLPGVLRAGTGGLLTEGEIRRFVDAGLHAVRRDEPADSWVQFGLAPRAGGMPGVYRRLAGLAARALEEGWARDFFFMHKPPGLRVRFRVDPHVRTEISDDLREGFAGWQVDGLVDGVTAGVYEPEEQLFGGPASMPHVHRLFTADSLAWLARSGVPDPGPAWTFSLALLSVVLPSLGIAGWEDLEVWRRVRDQCRRTVPDRLDPGRVAAAADGVRAAWADPDRMRSALPAPVIAGLDAHGPALAAATARWHDDYFAGRQALIGPREATAFFVIFHWNRGGLGPATQALVTGALADRTARP